MAQTATARILAEVAAALEGGPPVLVATVIDAPAGATAEVGAKMLVRPDGVSVGGLGDEILDAAVLDEAPDVFRRHSVETVYVDRSGQRLSRRYGYALLCLSSLVICAILFRTFDLKARVAAIIFDSNGPGATAFTVMCRGPSSRASTRVRWCSAALLDEYE